MTTTEFPEPARVGPPPEWLAVNAAARPERDAKTVSDLLASLWKPTPAEYVAKLSRYVGPKDTPRNQRDRKQCSECHNYHEFPAIHLDYVGHSDTCRMIAAVDPAWGWWPVAGWDDFGEPRFVRDNTGYPTRLWIWLDVLGVYRLGVGTVEKGPGKSDPEKELLGDAIRNAAQRFGVAADLWSKATGDAEPAADAPAPARATRNGNTRPAPKPAPAKPAAVAPVPPADAERAAQADADAKARGFTGAAEARKLHGEFATAYAHLGPEERTAYADWVGTSNIDCVPDGNGQVKGRTFAQLGPALIKVRSLVRPADAFDTEVEHYTPQEVAASVKEREGDGFLGGTVPELRKRLAAHLRAEAVEVGV